MSISLSSYDFNQMLYRWITEVTGYPDGYVIKANQNGPRPSEVSLDDYATYQIISIAPSDYSDVKKSEFNLDLVQAEYTNKSIMAVSVNVYAGNGRQIIQALLQSRYTLIVRNLLREYKAVLLGASDTRDLTELGDTEYRDRYQADYTFGIYEGVSELYEKIKEYDNNGNWDDLEVSITL